MAEGRLAGRVAVVTGAASGIGLSSAELFAAEGARVLLVDIAIKAGECALERVRAQGEAGSFAIDVSEDGAGDAIVGEAVRRFGAIDILLLNAGVHGSGATPAERFDSAIATNLRAVYLTAEAAHSHLSKSGGSIVITASVAGAIIGFASPQYDASKAGLIGLTRDLASRWGRHGIRVNAVCPGFIETPFIGSDWSVEELAEVRRRTALERFGTPEEIARVALFLASEDSSYVTGAAIVADGGWTIHFTHH